MKHLRQSLREALHAEIGHKLFSIRDTAEDLIAIRQRDHGQLLDDELEELAAILEALTWLCNDIKASRAH